MARYLEQSSCVSCGQCMLVCPVGALAERDDIEVVQSTSVCPDIFTVVPVRPGRAHRPRRGVQHASRAPSSREDHHRPRNSWVPRLSSTPISPPIWSLWRRAANCSTGSATRGCLPLIHLLLSRLGQFRREELPRNDRPSVDPRNRRNSASGRWPRAIWPTKMGVDPDKIRVISIMPCTAKKE